MSLVFASVDIEETIGGSGVTERKSVRAAEDTAKTLATAFDNGKIVDGVTLATNDRILITAQATASENGIYIVANSGVPIRASDLDTGFGAASITVFVEEGTNNADTEWTCTNDGPNDIVGTDGLTFQKTGGIDMVTLAGTQTVTNKTIDGSNNTITNIDHGTSLTGLADDDHTQYALLAGRASGQTLIGGTADSDTLTLRGTAHATPVGGAVLVAPATDGDEVTFRVDSGGVVNPHVNFEVRNTTTGTDTYNMGWNETDNGLTLASTEDGASRSAMAFTSDGAGSYTTFGITGSTDSGVTWDPLLTVNQTGDVAMDTGTNLRLGANHVYMGQGYKTVAARSGGLVLNYLPTATTDTVATGGFTAGVAATSNPTVATTGAATFAVSDIIEISGARVKTNNGIFEVLSHAANVLTVRGIGVTAAVETWTRDQFKTDTTVAGVVTKINASILRSGTDGAWETGAGSTTGVTFRDLVDVSSSQTLTNKTISAASNTLTINMDDLGDADTTTVVPTTDDFLTWNGTNWVPITNNFAGTAGPTVNDDVNSTPPYYVGSRWIDITSDNEYVCVDNTDGAAVWLQTAGDSELASVQARRTTTYTLTTGYVDITFDATDVENDIATVEHDNTNTDRVTVKETGVYLISYNFNVDATTSSGTTYAEGRVRINDTTELNGSYAKITTFNDGSIPNSLVPQHLGTSIVVSLTANDYLSLQLKYTNNVANTGTNGIFKVIRLKGSGSGGGGGSGETNTAINVGTGEDIFKQKTGVNLEFRGIEAGSSKVTTAVNGDNIDIDVSEANLNLNNIGGTPLDETNGGTGITSYNQYDTLAATAANTLSAIKNNETSTSPTVTDDNAAGYTIGSRWRNTTTDYEYVLMDDTNGAAVWRITSNLQEYDCIVSTDPSMGDYLLPSAAFDAGCKTVFMRDGTYVETGDVTIPNGGGLYGESVDQAIIQLSGTSFSNTAASASGTGGAGFTKITASGHTFSNGDVIYISGTLPTTAYPEGSYTVSSSSTNIFDIDYAWSTVASTTHGTSSFGRVICDGNGGLVEAAGTISITNGTSAVTGVGTTFTNISLPAFLIINHNAYPVASITDATNLAIGPTFNGETVSGHTYMLLPMYSSIIMENMTITSSAGTGLYLRALRHAVFDSVIMRNNRRATEILCCANCNFQSLMSQNSGNIGIHVKDTSSCVLEACQSFNSGSHGYQVSGISDNVIIDATQGSNSDGNGLNVTGSATGLIVTGCIFNNNTAKGINTDSGTGTATIKAVTMQHNGTYGIDIDGMENVIDGCIIGDNGDSGIRAGESGVIVSNHVYSNALHGVELEADDFCQVTGNNIHNNTATGVYIDRSGNSISTNTIKANGTHGVHIDDAVTAGHDNSITGNFIEGNTSNGVQIDTGSLRNIVTSNVIRNNVIGINVMGTSHNTNVSSNNVTGNSSHGICIAGDRSAANGNIVTGNGGDGLIVISGATDVTVLANNLQNNTGANFTDNGTVTSLEGILINEIDARSATTMLIGKAIATKLELADTGIVTEIQGNLDALEGLDVTGNETITGYVQFADMTAPANPSAGEGRLYKKTGDDGIFWKPDAAGPEVDLTTMGSGGAPDSASYVTISTDATLTSERTLSAGTGLDLVDGGAGNNVTLNIDSTVATLTGAQTLTNKTLTLPQINDTSADHQYIFGVSELTLDRTVTLPLLTGNDTFVFEAFAQTLTNKTLTSPRIGTSILDTAGLELLKLTATASAVNELTLANAATGAGPILSATGTDANIDINITPKAAGNIVLDGLSWPNADGAADQVLKTDGAGNIGYATVDIMTEGTVSTSDATVTTIGTIATSSDTAYIVTSTVIGYDATGDKSASYKLTALFRNDAGTLTRVGIDVLAIEDAAQWDGDIAVSGTNMIITVKGQAATNINWKSVHKVTSVS